MELLDKHEIETGNEELLGQKNCAKCDILEHYESAGRDYAHSVQY